MRRVARFAALLSVAMAAWLATSEIVPSAVGAAAALRGTTWHTVQIQGDALFFLVEEVGIRFEADGRFAARVRFVDGQRVAKTGTYRVDGDTALVTIDGNPTTKELQFWSSGSDLIVRDKAFDVTARLVPGQMDESWL